MKNIQIRKATTKDNDALKSFCLADNPDDFVPDIWPVWMSGNHSVNLVALTGDVIIGCLYGEILSGRSAWSQGLRVSSKYRRSGIATALANTLYNLLQKEGAEVIYGNISRFNTASLSVAYKNGWKDECHIFRRRVIPQKQAMSLKPVSAFGQSGDILIRQHPVLASIQKTAFFKRIYYVMDTHYIDQASNRNAIRISSDEKAYAILDFETDPAKKIWVTAMGGQLSGMLWLIERFYHEATLSGVELIIDSMDDPAIQSLMDKLAFEPAGKEGSYIIVKKILTGT